MSKTLEEKKIELAKEYCKDWPQEVYHPNDLKGFFEHGFDAGIKVYKEMLNESVEVKLDRDSIHDNVVEKWSEHWYDPKINEQDTANYRRRILSVDSNMRYSIARMMSEYVEPVLAKLQQQTEKITELESRLKEAESVIAYYASTKNKVHVSKISENEDEEIGNFVLPFEDHDWPIKDESGQNYFGYVSGKLARQYMEKVK